MTRGTEESHDPPSVSWRHRKAGGVVWGHKARKPMVWIPHQVWRPEILELRGRVISISALQSDREWLQPCSAFSCCSWRPAVNRRMLNITYITEGHLCSAYWFKCFRHPEIPSWTYPEIMFNPISGHPVAQLRWHVKLIITPDIQKCHSWKEGKSQGNWLDYKSLKRHVKQWVCMWLDLGWGVGREEY